MKIIAVDNFNRDHVDDILIAEGIKEEEWGTCMLDALNAKFCDYDSAPYFYRLVEDNYELKKWEP